MFFVQVFLTLLTLSPSSINASHRTRHRHRRHDLSGQVVNLKKAKSSPASSRALSQQRPRFASHLESVENGAGYAVEIVVGGQTFAVHLDTGSSDLWLPTSNFQCLGPDGSPAPQDQCQIGPTYTGSSQNQINDQQFNITYGDGEFLAGSMTYQSVSLGGLAVPKQEVALVNAGFWQGDGETSGLMGFAYPSLTAATQETSYGDVQAPYLPFFFNAIQQGLVPPVFIVALGKNTQDASVAGQIGLGGGLPNIHTTTSWTSTPLQSVQLTPDPVTATNFSYYTIIPDAFILQNQPLQQPSAQQADTNTVIIDSGTTLIYLPATLTNSIAAAFSPPATYVSTTGLWQAACDATPPSFAVRIGGQNLFLRGDDLLLSMNGGYDPSTGGCIVGIQDANGGPSILGDAFLRNVVVEVDVGRGMVGMAGR